MRGRLTQGLQDGQPGSKLTFMCSVARMALFVDDLVTNNKIGDIKGGTQYIILLNFEGDGGSLVLELASHHNGRIQSVDSCLDGLSQD